MKLSQKSLAAALGVSGARVTVLKARGIPVHSIDAARRWRDRHLDPVMVESRRHLQQGRVSTMDTSSVARVGDDRIAWLFSLLMDAGEEIVARLVGSEGTVSVATANIQMSAVTYALAATLERQGYGDNDIFLLAGPLAACMGSDDEIAERRARIQARVAEWMADIRARNGAVDVVVND